MGWWRSVSQLICWWVVWLMADLLRTWNMPTQILLPVLARLLGYSWCGRTWPNSAATFSRAPLRCWRSGFVCACVCMCVLSGSEPWSDCTSVHTYVFVSACIYIFVLCMWWEFVYIFLWMWIDVYVWMHPVQLIDRRVRTLSWWAWATDQSSLTPYVIELVPSVSSLAIMIEFNNCKKYFSMCAC